jgi:hypothetical protein
MATPKSPGGEGSKQDQIQTPMNEDNVDSKGGGETHSYKKITGGISKGGSVSIAGPGAEANWDTQVSIKGSNKGKY